MPNTPLFQIPPIQPRQTSTKEKTFYQVLKKAAPEHFVLTRVESIYPGYPDLTLINLEKGKIIQIELKVSVSEKVKLSPAQISYLTKSCKAPVYILVIYIPSQTKKQKRWILFESSQAVRLSLHGLAKTEPALVIENKQYEKLFDYLQV